MMCMIQTYTEDMIPLTMEDKKVVHQQALWHKVVSALVMNGTHLFLQTIYPKESYGFERPDYLDVSIGGHVEEQETEQEALLREAKEELGLSDVGKIEFVRIRKIKCDPSPTYRIREFQYLYRIYVHNELKDFDLAETDPEVKSIVAIDKKVFVQLLNKDIKSLSAQEALFNKKSRELIGIKNRIITSSDFIPDYLEQKLFESLLV